MISRVEVHEGKLLRSQVGGQQECVVGGENRRPTNLGGLEGGLLELSFDLHYLNWR